MLQKTPKLLRFVTGYVGLAMSPLCLLWGATAPEYSLFYILSVLLILTVIQDDDIHRREL